jgi:enoyl-CoA hydratase/carnithine racemase
VVKWHRQYAESGLAGLEDLPCGGWRTGCAPSGDVIDARTALDWGLVNRVVPGAQLDDAVHDLLERTTRGSAQNKGIGNQPLCAQIDLDRPKAYSYAVEVMAATSQLPDAQEGSALLVKRKRHWLHGR